MEITDEKMAGVLKDAYRRDFEIKTITKELNEDKKEIKTFIADNIEREEGVASKVYVEVEDGKKIEASVSYTDKWNEHFTPEALKEIEDLEAQIKGIEAKEEAQITARINGGENLTPKTTERLTLKVVEE